MLANMTSGKWSLRSWKHLVDDWISNPKDYIPGMRKFPLVKSDIIAVIFVKEVLESFTNDELDDSSKINSLTLARVANNSTGSIDEVNAVWACYQQSQIAAVYLQKRKINGEPLPKNATELLEWKYYDPRWKKITKDV